MTKVLYSINVFLLVSTMAMGQARDEYDKLLSAGNAWFHQEQYHLAVEFYRKALTFNISDPSVDYNLAESYRKLFNYPEAEVYYLKVLYTAQDHYPLSLYYYALMLKLNGDFSESIQRFDQFIAFHGTNIAYADFVEQAWIDKRGCEIAKEDTGLPVAVKAQLAGGEVNTTFNDFAPAFRDRDQLVITSSRIGSNRKLIDHRNGQGFTDNYYLRRVAGQWQDQTRREFSRTNSTYHDGSGSFTRKGNEYFFTVCEATCKIFETHFENGEWSKPAALNQEINDPLGEAKHPAISPGGDTLYFATDRPGGFGKFDIWMSVDAGNNAWAAPVNLGKAINTKANDLAPSAINATALLFFASDGHPGYGGFDFFMAKTSAFGDTVVYNLNYPFNSVKDDCFIAFNGEDIYWSSNRDGGTGGFDIYTGRNITPMALASRLSRKNRNDSRMVTLTSRTARSEHVTLLASRNEETIDYNDLTYERKTVVNQMVNNRVNNLENQPFHFPGITAEEFLLLNEISRSRFQAMLLKEKYASTLLSEVLPVLSDEGTLSITGQLIDSVSGFALHGAKVLLTNEYGEILKITSTNAKGHFRFTDVTVNTRLFLRVGNATVGAASAQVRHITTQGSAKQNSLYVENVYFDFDHYVIRPEAAQVLADLASYLKKNPGSQVEIYAFADDRGSSAYNFELTQKRGEAVVAFLTRNGVDATSLAIIPKGKQNMRFATNELQRQFNRRAEFHINGFKENVNPAAKTYILKKEADWALISRITGISKEELKILNGSHTEVVKAFQPIRLPMTATTVSEELFFVGI